MPVEHVAGPPPATPVSAIRPRIAITAKNAALHRLVEPAVSSTARLQKSDGPQRDAEAAGGPLPGRERELLGGHDTALRCPATRLAQLAQSELRLAGARPRRDALTGAESLTPGERRVVDLVADGMSNREAAQSLFLTEKTVETHLGHAYAKLGINSRRDLVAAVTQGAGSR